MIKSKLKQGTMIQLLSQDHQAECCGVEKHPFGFDGLKPYISGKANLKYIYGGLVETGFGWTDQISSRIADVPTTEQLFNRMIAEAEQVRKKWGS